ncbi:MAG: DUF429 domain-containing protein [Cyanobium sp.]
MTRRSLSSSGALMVVGIDVGGARKGFHAVALRNGAWTDQRRCRDATELAQWCRETVAARVIAIDAPCRWRTDGRMRPSEQALLQEGIRCFASPSREQALAHPSNYYGWMLQGEALYRELEPSHPLCRALPIRGPVCFETFPHAITWQLRGGHAEAALKRQQRQELLRGAGIALTTLRSIDWIDAALCALAADRIARGDSCRSFGEPESGLILVPTG